MGRLGLGATRRGLANRRWPQQRFVPTDFPRQSPCQGPFVRVIGHVRSGGLEGVTAASRFAGEKIPDAVEEHLHRDHGQNHSHQPLAGPQSAWPSSRLKPARASGSPSSRAQAATNAPTHSQSDSGCEAKIMIVAIVEGPATNGTASGTRNGSPSLGSSALDAQMARAGKNHPHSDQKQQHAAGNVERIVGDAQQIHHVGPKNKNSSRISRAKRLSRNTTHVRRSSLTFFR